MNRPDARVSWVQGARRAGRAVFAAPCALALCCGGCGTQAAGDAGAGCPYDPPQCQRNSLLACGPEGGVVETPCGEARCAADAPVPRCVPASAEPCDPLEDAPTCENGGLRTCDAASLYPETTDCGSGQLCVLGDGDVPACAPVEDQRCSTNDFTPLCVFGRRIECDPDRRRLRETGGC